MGSLNLDGFLVPLIGGRTTLRSEKLEHADGCAKTLVSVIHGRGRPLTRLQCFKGSERRELAEKTAHRVSMSQLGEASGGQSELATVDDALAFKLARSAS